MTKDLSYLDPEGFTVFTSEFHRKRGRCCNSSCLHCPFGHTIKKYGLTFQIINEADQKLVNSLIGEKPSKYDWREFLPENALLMSLKGVVCGIVLKNHIVIKELILKDEFSHQGITKELAEAYLF
jgi:hypothetical protein